MYGVLWDLVSAMGWIILLPIIIFVAVFEKQIMDGYHGVLGESGIAGSGCFEVPTVCVRIEASKNYGQLTKICPTSDKNLSGKTGCDPG